MEKWTIAKMTGNHDADDFMNSVLNDLQAIKNRIVNGDFMLAYDIRDFIYKENTEND